MIENDVIKIGLDKGIIKKIYQMNDIERITFSWTKVFRNAKPGDVLEGIFSRPEIPYSYARIAKRKIKTHKLEKKDNGFLIRVYFIQ